MAKRSPSMHHESNLEDTHVVWGGCWVNMRSPQRILQDSFEQVSLGRLLATGRHLRLITAEVRVQMSGF